MSNLIQQFADQAKSQVPQGILSPELWIQEYNRIFAELIVRDCLEQIESQRSSGENSDQWTITRDLCYHNMMADLKEHFGVE